MSNELQSVLDDIKLDKQNNLKPNNIKKDITVLGVTGTLEELDTSDATATINDLIKPKSAYVNGKKIVGAISQVTEATGVPSYDEVSYSNTTGKALLATCFRHNLAVTRVNNYTVRVHKVINGIISNDNEYVDISNTTLISGSASYYIYNVGFGTIDIDSNNVYLLFSWAVDKSNFRASILPLNFKNLTIGEPKSVSFGRYTDGGTWSQILVARPNDPSTFVVAHNCNTNGEQHEMWGIYLNANGQLSKAFEYVTTWYGAPRRNFGRWSADGKYFYYTDASKTQKIYEVSSDGTVWTLLQDGYSAVPIPLLDNNAIESKNIYDYPGKTLVGTSDISITRANTNYYIISNFIFVLTSSILYIYQLNPTSIISIGSISSVSSVFIDGNILCVIDTSSVIHFIDINKIPQLVLGLIRNGTTYLNTSEATILEQDVLNNKIAYSKNGKVIGTMPNNGELNYTPSTEEQTIPAGYTSGGIVSAVNNQDKEITENGTYIADEGYNGLGTVTINVPTLEDLQEQLNAQDTIIEELRTELENKARSKYQLYLDMSLETSTNELYHFITEIAQDAINLGERTSTNSMFNNFDHLITIPLLDTSNVTDMQYMFQNCSSLTTIPQLNTSSVTNMSYIFRGCKSLTAIPLFDTSNVTDMRYMFYSCTSLTTIPQLNTSKVITMLRMFQNCSSLTTIPQLDTSSVTNMQYMFIICTNLSDESLNNILAMCKNATSYTSTKTLADIGLTEEQANKCKTLSNYEAFTTAGWTTGY